MGALTGTLVNAGAIVLGAALGLLLKRGIPKRVSETVMQGLALAVMVIGLSMALGTGRLLVVISALVLGGALGAWVRLEERLASGGAALERAVGRWAGPVGKAFVTTSVLYCTGAMAIVGAIEDGLAGNPGTLLAKAGIDGVASIMFAATLGVGVALSAVPVLLYQGSISLLAAHLEPLLTPALVADISATGGILIVAIGVDLLGMARMRTVNLLPAIPVAGLVAYLLG